MKDLWTRPLKHQDTEERLGNFGWEVEIGTVVEWGAGIASWFQGVIQRNKAGASVSYTVNGESYMHLEGAPGYGQTYL